MTRHTNKEIKIVTVPIIIAVERQYSTVDTVTQVVSHICYIILHIAHFDCCQ